MTGILLSRKGGVMKPMRNVSRVLRMREDVVSRCWGCAAGEESGVD